MTLRLALASLLLLGAAPSGAAGRIPYGGELRLAHTGPAEPAEPALSDTPTEATLLGLLTQPACRLGPDGQPTPALALELSRPSPQVVRLTLPSPAHASALARAWVRLTRGEVPSPYRALLFPLRAEGRQLAATGDALELTLSFPWPDLERALCHPALAPPRAPTLPLAPFAPTSTPGTLEARPGWPRGRPYVDKLLLTATHERGLYRLWNAHETQVTLGLLAEPTLGAFRPPPGASPLTGPALYATYLAWTPRRVPADFRQAVESVLSREDLARDFVSGPAVPMPHLLPPALLSQAPGARPAKPPVQPGRKVTLLYEADSKDQRAVAERLQLQLNERGYVVALTPLPRAELRARQARGDYELMLHALLLPPVPGPALAVVLEAAGRGDLLGVELARIGGLADAAARDTRARERAVALAASVPMLPLYTQGVVLHAAPEVGGLVLDAQGLPLLDAAFLLPPAPAGATGARR
jgi:hypothetical protein